VWSTFLASDASPTLSFGRDLSETRRAGCVNPAAPQGGRAALKAYLPKPPTAPESDPPFLLFPQGLTAECVTDPKGAVLRVTVEPGALQAPLTTALSRPGLPGWGLHTYDVNLTIGNLLDVTEAKLAAWSSGRR
jgi:hypothetical protein